MSVAVPSRGMRSDFLQAALKSSPTSAPKSRSWSQVGYPCANGRSTSPLANITLHHSSKNTRAQSFSRCCSSSSPDAAGHALCAVTSARESRLYCSGLHAELASHCHVVQECSNLVSGVYAGNRALDCARTLGLAPLTGHPSMVHSPMRPEYSTSLLVRARLLFAFLTVVCFSPRCRCCLP